MSVDTQQGGGPAHAWEAVDALAKDESVGTGPTGRQTDRQTKRETHGPDEDKPQAPQASQGRVTLRAIFPAWE